MVIWVNGTFGVGKTTTATRLVGMAEGLRLFDPEWVGYLLAHNLADFQVNDFQDLPPWRALVPPVAEVVARFTGQELVAVQTVLDESYWHELRTGLEARGMPVLHVLLDATPAVLHARIDADPDGIEIRRWRHDHVDVFVQARAWLLQSADLLIDTTNQGPDVAAAAIFGAYDPAALSSPH